MRPNVENDSGSLAKGMIVTNVCLFYEMINEKVLQKGFHKTSLSVIDLRF